MTPDARNTEHARRLRRFVEQALAAHEQRGEAGVEDVLRSCGSDADLVRARLALLLESGLLETGGAATSTSSIPSLPARLGEFVPLRKLGEGAMGVVWAAEQPSLSRRVALKVIRPEYAWIEGARERFRREAEAVARLRHPVIVPVYAVGEEAGVSYLAFELVEGLALDRLLAELASRKVAELTGALALEIIAERDGLLAASSGVPALFRGKWLDVAVRIVQALCEALAHAHERGILHRDLKPSNVMLTREGEVRLLDFGLAAAEGAPALTREGAAPGSLAYMAPELLGVHGATADARSEVYALGVCFYELLRLRPPFEGSSMLAVRTRILHGDCERLHQSRHALPWELLAIVETAMDRAPSRRYAGVAALGADLRRYLAREPIAARRSGPVRRTWRWIERHPAPATAIAFFALLLVAVPSAIAVQQARDAGLVLASLQRSNEAGARAEQSVRALLGGIDRMLVEVATLDLQSAPGADGARRRVLEDARELLLEVQRREGDRPEIRRAVARASVRRAILFLEHDRQSDARAAIAEAQSACAAMLRDRDAELEGLELSAECQAALASLASSAGDAETAFDCGARAVELLERALARDGTRASTWLQLAMRYQENASVASSLERFDPAIARFDDAERAYARVLEIDPSTAIEDARGQGRFNRASTYGNAGQHELAAEWARRALADLDLALAREPEAVTPHEFSALAWQVLSVHAHLQADTVLERTAIERCAEHRRWLLERFPERASLRVAVAESCRELARLRGPGGLLENEAEARELRREAAEHLRRVDEPSSDRDFVLGMVLYDLAHDATTLEQRLAYFEEALSLCRGLAAQSAMRPRSAYLGSAVGAELAITLQEHERYGEASRAAAEAQTTALEALRLRPERVESRQRAVNMALLRAEILSLQGQAAQGAEVLRELHAVLPLTLADLDVASRGEALRECAEFRALSSELRER